MSKIEELEELAHAAEPGAQITVDAADVLDLINELRTVQASIRIVARHAVAAVEASGQVIAVERVPLLPLKMGHHTAEITFRPKRSEQ